VKPTPVQFAPPRLERRDITPATAIAAAMVALFVVVGGKPLLVTFVPGVAATWVIFVRMCMRDAVLPKASRFLPLYYLTIAWQFAHFGEELATGFHIRFPELYGAEPFPSYVFILFNMVSYLAFLLATLLVFARHLHFFLIPVLFFIVYGAIGNAVAHTFWAVVHRGYFPGLFTAQAYWVLGPLLLSRLIGSRREALVSALGFAILLVVVLILFTPRP
jgi:hypothetical protein